MTIARRVARLTGIVTIAAAPVSVASAQTTTPEALATLVMERFATGTPEAFAAVYPDSAGRVFMREARGTRRTELAQVVWKSSRRAILLLAGVARTGGGAARGAAAGGNETNGARHFSGFYEAIDSAGSWRLTRQIPFDSANYIRAHALQVDVAPATGLRVVDTMTVTVGTPYGIGLRLNNAAHLTDVRVGGVSVDHAFGGGVLWVKAPRTARARIVLSYSLDVGRAPRDTAKVPAAPAFGAFHNTDVWHPFFHYLSANDKSQISATVRIPAEYYLTTTIPQTDTVRNGVRTVYAKSGHGAFLLALIYDRDWQPRTTDFGTFRFESFTGPGFRHSHDSLAAVTKRVYDVLAPRFGEPQFPSHYLAAVQDRALGGGGFSVRMNNAAISGTTGGATLQSSTALSFAHETGHAWTLNSTGKASNFLHEAWATYVEGLVLRAWYSPDDERAFWERQRDSYMVGNDRQGFAGGMEGNQSILANYDNGRIHYRKGVWILYSGNHVMGDSAFNRGMRLFIANLGKGPAGYEELIAAWSKAAGHSMKSFVMPWLTSKYIPNVDARVEERRLIVTQSQPDELFDLPKLDIELTTPSGVVRQTVHLSHRADTVALDPAVASVSSIRVDPDHAFLLQRHWGEPIVRFALPVSRTGSDTSVMLNGNFLRQPMAARRAGDEWVVELPMTEGQYTWIWQVGKTSLDVAAQDSTLTGTRTVRGLERITNAYPGR